MPKLSFMVQKNGVLTDGARKTCANIIASLANKHIIIDIYEKKEKRSLDSNAYYRGVILPHVRAVMMENGDARSLDDWHEALLETFSPLVEVMDMDNNLKLRPLRTHLMGVGQMNAFVTAIIAEMASLGYPVPMREL